MLIGSGIDCRYIIETVSIDIADFSVPDSIFVNDNMLELYLAGKGRKNKAEKTCQNRYSLNVCKILYCTHFLYLQKQLS